MLDRFETVQVPGKPGTDPWMSHFMSQTWSIQGPDFESNTLANMSRLTKETMWPALPPIECDTALVVGAGPSLAKNLESLKKNGEDMFVLCTDRALPFLVNAGFKPYACTVLEATIESLYDIKSWWMNVDTEDIPLVTVPYADPDLFDLWKGPVYFINAFSQSKQLVRLAGKIQWKTGCPLSTVGNNVGVMSLLLAGQLLVRDGKKGGVGTIRLIGMDHCFQDVWPQVNICLKDINGTGVWLPWNFFIGQYEVRFLTSQYKTIGIRVENCTEGGILYGEDIVRGSL